MNRSRLPIALFWIGFALFVAGFAFSALRHAIAVRPLAGFIGLTLISLALAWGVRRLLRCAPASSMLIVWLAALVGFAGIPSALAVLLVAAAAVAVGSAVDPDGEERPAMAALVGLALLCGVVGWLLPFPLHTRVTYVAVLGVIVVLRRRAVFSAIRMGSRQWSSAVSAAPRAAFLVSICIGLVSTCTWLPTIDFDALAYHLALPSQLAELGYYQMNAGSNVWALAPWAADVSQAIVWLIAGGESIGVVGVMWFGLTLVLLWQLARELALAPWLRWLAVALYGSLPLIAGALTSMQTEVPTAAVMAGIALLTQGVRVPNRRHLATAGVLFGLLLALKLSNVMFAGPLGLWLLWQWRQSKPWCGLPLALLLAVVVAGSSYVYAFVLTGNPVLPLFNAVFRSPFYPIANFHDHRWDSGLVWNLPWRLVFDSSIYGEMGNGAGPFILIAMAGSLLLALVDKRSRGLVLAGLLAFALPLTQIQYLRYPMPAMVLLIPAMLTGLRSEHLAPPAMRAIAFALGGVVVASLAFVSSASWQLNTGALVKLLAHGSHRLIDRYAVERDVAAAVRHRYGESGRTLLLDPTRPFAAEWAGRAFVVAWYDPELSTLATEARKTDKAADWGRLIDRSGVNLLLVPDRALSAGLKSAIERDRGAVAYEVGDLRLWGLHPNGAASRLPPPGEGRDLFAERDLARSLRASLAFWSRTDSMGIHTR
jgi:hypothetical protein